MRTHTGACGLTQGIGPGWLWKTKLMVIGRRATQGCRLRSRPGWRFIRAFMRLRQYRHGSSTFRAWCIKCPILPIGMNAAMSVKFVVPFRFQLSGTFAPEHVNDDLVRQICESSGFNRATDCIVGRECHWDKAGTGYCAGRQAHPLHLSRPRRRCRCRAERRSDIRLPEFAIHLLESMGFVPFALIIRIATTRRGCSCVQPSGGPRPAGGRDFMRCGVPDGTSRCRNALCACGSDFNIWPGIRSRPCRPW